VRVAAAAGCSVTVLTNGCGGLRSDLAVGQPVLIADHLNLTATSPLVGARFVDLTDLYSARLRALMREIDPSLTEGVYAQFPGPHYETPAEVRAHVAEGYAIDATRMAEELGNERAANVVLIGALSTALDFPAEDWEKALSAFVPKKTISVNLDAFRVGRNWITEARGADTVTEARGADTVTNARTALPAAEARVGVPAIEAPAANIPAPVESPYSVRLEITPQWCKSCDICVKLCPERCLRLNQERVVELAQPDKCTGCRLCELLCPDFAIKVHLDAVGDTVATARGIAP
jgi:NAD-dependent dihydropyrimidine dehydrogenase PreA subunit